MASLSEYNNNPGNIKPPEGITYPGQIGIDENGFAIFKTPDFGKKALINDIQAKIEKHNYNNPSDFVSGYLGNDPKNSPESVDNYKIYLADKLGLKSTKDPFPKDSYDKIANAISEYESGHRGHEDNYAYSPSASSQQNNMSDYAYSSPPQSSVVSSPEYQNELAKKDLYTKAAIGAGAGTAFGASVEAAKDILPIIPGVARYFTNKLQPNVGAPVNPQSPESLSKITLGGEGTGAAKYAQNLMGMSPIEAARVTGMGKGEGEAWDIQKKIQAANQRLGSIGYTPENLGMTNEGVILPFSKSQAEQKGFVPRPTQVPEDPSVLSRIGSKIASNPILKGLGRVGLSGLGGALAVVQGNDVAQRIRDEGYTPENISDAIGAIGGGLMTIPSLPTEVIGGAMQLAPLSYNLGRKLTTDPTTGQPLDPLSQIDLSSGI